MKIAQASVGSLSIRPVLRPQADFVCLKASVRRKLMSEFTPALPVALIRRAVDEAVLTAESTGFPHLFFPILAEEQVERISRLSGLSDLAHADTHRSGFVSAA